jgi:putative DNA methylase
MKTISPGWHSRGYLPHLEMPGLIQFISFRLEDAMPVETLKTWQQELRLIPAEKQKRELRMRIEKYLDAGHGSCFLKEPRIARLVENALLFFDGNRYRLLAWVVMPNHVHVLIETLENHPLSGVIQAWKSYTSSTANQMLGRQGNFWQRDYFDRYIRDDGHLQACVEYIHQNPVKAGLVKRPEAWVYSSANRLAGVSSPPPA